MPELIEDENQPTGLLWNAEYLDSAADRAQLS